MHPRLRHHRTTARPRRRMLRLCGRAVLRACHILVAVAASSVAALAVLLTVASIRPLPLGAWLGDVAEARLARHAASQGMRAEVGGLDIALRRGLVPVLTARDFVLWRDGQDTPVATLDSARMVLNRDSLLVGAIRPRSLNLQGIRITARREGGGVTLAFGQEDLLAALGSPGDLIAGLGAILDRPMLARLETLGLGGISLAIEDLPNGVVWEARSGSLRLSRDAGEVALDLTLAELGNGTGVIRAQIAGDPSTRAGRLRLAALGVNPAAFRPVEGSVPLSALGQADATVTATLATQIEPGGAAGPLLGRVSVGEGHWTPPAGPRLAFRGFGAGLELSADQTHLRLNDLHLDSDLAGFGGHAQVLIDIGSQGALTGATLQLSLRQLFLAAELGLSDDLHFGFVEAALRYDPETGRVTLAPSDLVEGDRALRIGGWVEPPASATVTELTPRPIAATRPVKRPLPEGWRVAVDVSAPRLGLDDMLALWPPALEPRTRDWVAANMLEGETEAPRLSLRLPATGRIETGLSARFSGLRMIADPDLPEVTGAAGTLTLQDRALGITVSDASMPVAGEAPVTITRATASRSDVSDHDLPLSVVIDAMAPAATGLRLLEAPLFQPRDRPPEPLPVAPDAVAGNLALTVALSVPVGPQRDPRYRVTGTLRDGANNTLLPGHRLRTERLAIEAETGAVAVTGPVTMDGHPAEVSWRRALGRGAPEGSQLDVTAPLTQGLAAALGLPLSPAQMQGTGQVTAEVTLGEGAPRIDARADLTGLRLSVPGIGLWKPSGRAGTLQIVGALGDAPRFDRLEIDTAGLSASGTLALRRGGGLERLSLARARLGGWFDGPVTLSPGTGGRTDVALGGSLDLRNLPDGGGGGGGNGLGRVRLGLDRLRVADGMSLTGVSGTLDVTGTPTGNLTGRVNGGAPLNVDLNRLGGGQEIRVYGKDAGRVLRDAGLFDKAYGGAFTLRLETTGAKGQYRGKLTIDDTVVRDAPVAASLLSAISLVGLAEQAGAGGLAFGNVQAKFVLTGKRVVITEASARGPSLGLSVDGALDTGSKTMDLQGVISPFFFLNRMGEGMTRRGEGVFGITFRLTGPFGAPRVSANPLSLLTPGMFREIFRRAPPKVLEPPQ